MGEGAKNAQKPCFCKKKNRINEKYLDSIGQEMYPIKEFSWSICYKEKR